MDYRIIFFLYIIAIAVILLIFIHRHMAKRLCIKEELTKCDEDELNVNEAGNVELGDFNSKTRRSAGTCNFNANYPADINESDLSEHFEDAHASLTSNNQMNSEVSTDVQRKNLDEEKSTENASGLCIVSDKSDNEEDKEESTGVFDDTVESLQRIASPTVRELCTELYNLLDIKGRKLTQEVLTATITRETGISAKTLLNNLTDQEKNKLKVMLPEKSHRNLEPKTEHDTLFHVSYGLHRIFLDEKHHPKSDWGNPVRCTDIGIGDDVERLYRIQTIVQGIANPLILSVESYIRLLDIMIEALIRLDPDAEFKEDYKLLSYKLESIKKS